MKTDAIIHDNRKKGAKLLFFAYYRLHSNTSADTVIDDHQLLQERNPNFHTCCISLLVSEQLFLELHLFLYAGSFQENQNTISMPNMKTTTRSSWTKVPDIWVLHISWRICKRFLQICNSGDLMIWVSCVFSEFHCVAIWWKKFYSTAMDDSDLVLLLLSGGLTSPHLIRISPSVPVRGLRFCILTMALANADKNKSFWLL